MLCLCGHIDRVIDWHAIVLGRSHVRPFFSVIFHYYRQLVQLVYGFYAFSLLFLLIQCKMGRCDLHGLVCNGTMRPNTVVASFHNDVNLVCYTPM